MALVAHLDSIAIWDPNLEKDKKQESASTPTEKPKEEKRSTNLAVNKRGLLMTSRAIAENDDTGIRMKARIFFDPGADS